MKWWREVLTLYTDCCHCLLCTAGEWSDLHNRESLQTQTPDHYTISIPSLSQTELLISIFYNLCSWWMSVQEYTVHPHHLLSFDFPHPRPDSSLITCSTGIDLYCSPVTACDRYILGNWGQERRLTTLIF